MSEKTIEEQREEFDRAQDKRAEDREKERAQQELVDLQELAKLRDEHESIGAVKMARFRRGQPTRAGFRMPERPEYKRYNDLIFRAAGDKKSAGIRDAQEQLARVCWVYPTTKEGRDAMLEAFPGVLTSIALGAAKLAEGAEEDEGKG